MYMCWIEVVLPSLLSSLSCLLSPSLHLVSLLHHSLSFSSSLFPSLLSLSLCLSASLPPSRLGSFQLPHVMSSFQMHAVIPVMQCSLNTVGEPQLCHATLCILREVSQLVSCVVSQLVSCVVSQLVSCLVSQPVS